MALLTVQRITPNGAGVTYQAADPVGDSFPNDGHVWLEVQNNGTASITVTVNSQRPCNYGFDHDLTVEVPAGQSRRIGPLDPQRFNDSQGRVQVTYSDATSVQVAAVGI